MKPYYVCFFLALSNYFSGKDGSALPEKNWPVRLCTDGHPLRLRRSGRLGHVMRGRVIFTTPNQIANYVKRCTRRTKFGERGFSFAGPAAWNSLPNDLQHCSNTDVFKKKLKTIFFQRAFITD